MKNLNLFPNWAGLSLWLFPGYLVADACITLSKETAWEKRGPSQVIKKHLITSRMSPLRLWMKYNIHGVLLYIK